MGSARREVASAAPRRHLMSRLAPRLISQCQYDRVVRAKPPPTIRDYSITGQERQWRVFAILMTASRTVPLPAALARKWRQPYRADKNDSSKVIDLPAADSFVVVC